MSFFFPGVEECWRRIFWGGDKERKGELSVLCLDKGKNKKGKDHFVLYKQYN